MVSIDEYPRPRRGKDGRKNRKTPMTILSIAVEAYSPYSPYSPLQKGPSDDTFSNSARFMTSTTRTTGESGPQTPVLPAYRLDPHPGSPCPRHCTPHSLVVWCAPCRRWHTHGGVSPEPGAGDGHRVAHCLAPTSPYVATGYVIEEAGGITAQEMRRSARVQKRQVEPCCLTEERKLWT